MGQILLVIKLLLITLPFFGIGYFLHDFHRFTPVWLHIIVTGVPLILSLYYVYLKRKVFFDEKAEHKIPELLHGSSYFYLVGGAILGFIISQAVFNTSLIIDNGRDTPIVVSVTNHDTVHVAPHESYEMTVPVATLEISIDDMSKIFSITEKGNWIYNVDSLNTYVRTSIKYSDEVTLTKEGSTDSTQTVIPDFEIIRSEFFNANVDYVFKAPETIKIKNRDSGKEVEKTVLYRLDNDEKE